MPELRDLLNLKPMVSHLPATPSARQQMTHTGPAPKSVELANGGGSLADYMKLLKGATIGSPEKLLTGNQEEIHTPFGDITYPSGAPDALAMLPFLGTAGEVAGDTMKGMKIASEPFFSALRRAIETKLPETFTGEQGMNVAKKFAKAEEIDWSKIGDFLKPGQRYNKADLMKHLDENAPQLHERMLGGRANDPMLQKRYQQYEQLLAIPEERRTPEQVQTMTNLTNSINAREAYPAKDTKFTKYTLPGGTNHRELVVTMPLKPADAAARETHFNNWLEEYMDARGDGVDPASLGLPNNRAVFDNLPQESQHGIRREYENNAFDDGDVRPGYTVPTGHAYGNPELDTNRLLHLRMNDRMTAEGEKALHVDELQSDWHQGARKLREKEIDRLMTEAKVNPLNKDLRPQYSAKVPDDFGYHKEGQRPSIEDKLAQNGWSFEKRPADGQYNEPYWSFTHHDGTNFVAPVNGTLEDAARFAGIAEGGNVLADSVKVPDAPFKKTWHELGMKRALQEAAQGGYDRLTWTTGKQQADRYSLAKHFDVLRYNPASGELQGHDKQGWEVVKQYVNGQKELEDTVGQEMADKLLNNPTTKLPSMMPKQGTDGRWIITSADGRHRMGTFDDLKAAANFSMENYPAWHEVRGADLEIGGEGMKGFYDQMLPSYMKKVGKKYGVEPEMVRVNGWDTKKPPYYVIDGRSPWTQPGEALERQDSKPAYFAASSTGIRKTQNTTLEEAQKAADKLNYGGTFGKDVWSLKMTPEMRKDILGEGQPMYEGVPPIPPVGMKTSGQGTTATNQDDTDQNDE